MAELSDEIQKLDINSLEIRRMKSTDVPKIMAIESVSFGRHHWSEESFLNEMRNQMGYYFSLVDKKSQELWGYCGCWLVVDECHVTTIATHPACRGQSLGEMLFVHLSRLMLEKQARIITLEVRVSNTPAQNLYYKYGFQSMGMRPKYYQDNSENALIMTTPDIRDEAYHQLLQQNEARLLDRIGQFPKGLGQLNSNA